ncbi:uncharacterized protein isoform X3 [Notothenia coriiceps]|uniref:Uncharacterized protein isoform X3 n=1 Tax=Notothenia coriiceps TaxID=8208 RepID=A0A6I9NQV6_9TELE|nr:PREDICTED: uncharacterized protein LOC104951822 isoform X3 [Notothenia coriiceps]
MPDRWWFLQALTHRIGLLPKTAMADSTPARLKVILGENNIEKLSLPNGIPESLDDLLSKLKTFFGLKGDVRLQYMDQDFGNDFFNLNSTTQLQDLGTIKVIHQQTNTPLNIATDTTSSSSLECDGNVSLASDDTIILSFPESVSSRAKQWPADFPIPQFSYDTELQLVKGNSEFNGSHKMLTVSSRNQCRVPEDNDHSSLRRSSKAQLDIHSSQLITVICAKRRINTSKDC